ncbi:MAG TPA: plastocyanin/azurin family copper-binding protein [Planococcus sp. (in: firmicutes)]|nr:plastocyanin/azurin family copper-binding protein [Planococcus sp. (in: firmicutes)]
MSKKTAALLFSTALVLSACGGGEDTPMMSVGIEASSGEASPLLEKGETTTYIFSDAGEYDIYCEPHPTMVMTVIVEEGADLSGEVASEMKNMQFSDQTLTVAPGTIITWTNEDEIEHNVAFQ